MQNYDTGLLEDPRPADKKEFDYLHSEVFGISPVSYYTDYASASKYVNVFPTELQNLTNSCVAHTKSLVISIFRVIKRRLAYVQLGPAFVYKLRQNSPNPGMFVPNANSITRNFGVPFYADFPTPQTDQEIDAASIPQAVFNEAALNKASAWISIDDPTNIDLIAFPVNTLGVAADILIFSAYEEWSVTNPTILYADLTISDPRANVRHNITVLPDSAFIDPATGKRCVIIEDSENWGGTQFRIVSEDFIKARCYGAQYLIDMSSVSTNNPIKYTFNQNLNVGSRGPDVMALQSVLQAMGFFPSIVDGQSFAPTGFYGGMTKKAVLSFQNANAAKILAPLGLSQGTGVFGISTRTFLNSYLAGL